MKNSRTLIKFYRFSCRYKIAVGIGIYMYLKPRFCKKTLITLKYYNTFFPNFRKWHEPQKSLILYLQVWIQLWSYKALHKMLDKFILKLLCQHSCESWCTIADRLFSIWNRVLTQKLWWKKLSNQRPTASTVGTAGRITLCCTRGEV